MVNTTLTTSRNKAEHHMSVSTKMQLMIILLIGLHITSHHAMLTTDQLSTDLMYLSSVKYDTPSVTTCDERIQKNVC